MVTTKKKGASSKDVGDQRNVDYMRGLGVGLGGLPLGGVSGW